MVIMQHILVTGGTGMLGRRIVPQFRNAGYNVQIVSRQPRQSEDGVRYLVGDLASGEGIDAAVENVEIIVHCAGSNKGDEEKTLNLVRAASRAGVRHFVYISVVGADRVPVVSGVDRAMFGYFASKLASERVVADSGLPWTILRATQFQESLFMVAKVMAKLPVIPVPAGIRFQPVSANEVADRLVQLTLGEPAGLVPEFGGPKSYTMADLLRGYLRANHQRRLFLPLWMPGRAARAHRAGANLTPDHAVGIRTWEDFLVDQLSPSRSIVPAKPLLS